MINPEDLAYKPPKRRFPNPSKRAGIALGIISSVLVLAGGTYFGWQHISKEPAQDTLGALEENKPQKEVTALVKEVRTKARGLPEQEIPSVATVNDIAKLSGQAFFEGATIGDKVIIYAIARQAVLYRPSTGKIIRQSPIEVENDPYAQQKNASESAEASSSGETVLKIKF